MQIMPFIWAKTYIVLEEEDVVIISSHRPPTHEHFYVQNNIKCGNEQINMSNRNKPMKPFNLEK